MSGRDDESCNIMRHHTTSRDIMRSGAGGVRCHSTEGVAEERRGGGSGSGSGSGRQVGAGGIRGSPYNHLPSRQASTRRRGEWNRTERN